MTPDVIRQLQELTGVVDTQMTAFTLVIIALMVGMSFFVIRFGNRLMTAFERNASEDDKRIDTFAELFQRQVEQSARQTEINERLASDTTARNQVQIEQAATLVAMLGELKAMRIDLKQWPELTASEIRNMREQIAALEQSVSLLLVIADKQREDALAVKEALAALTAAIDKLVAQINANGNSTIVNIETNSDSDSEHNDTGKAAA